jgi:hypothetical protein
MVEHFENMLCDALQKFMEIGRSSGIPSGDSDGFSSSSSSDDDIRTRRPPGTVKKIVDDMYKDDIFQMKAMEQSDKD